MNPIQLPRPVVNQLLQHAQSSPENEICGLISCKDSEIVRCYPVQNTASNTANLYQLDAKEQIAAFRHMRDNGEALFAIYHSHPHSPAEPSVIDLREASYPDAVYLIISLNTKGVLEMRGFMLRNQCVEELELELASE